MNGKKTKTMLVSKVVTSTKVSVKIDGDIIKQTDNYTYLGQTITSNGKCDDEILNWNCKRCIQFDVENINCSTHKYEKNYKVVAHYFINYKSICVVDTFIWMWNVDNTH